MNGIQNIRSEQPKIYYLKDNEKIPIGKLINIHTNYTPSNPKVIEFEVEGKILATTDINIDNIFINNADNRIKIPMPKKYIINKGATVLIWDDGEKTVVKRCADDEFNKRLGFLTAFFQHYSGMSKNKANKFLAELEVEDEEIEIKETKKPKHMKGEK